MSERFDKYAVDVAKRGIRREVKLGNFGPNATEIMVRGGSVCLTSDEAEQAAQAALQALDSAGFAVVRKGSVPDWLVEVPALQATNQAGKTIEGVTFYVKVKDES